jgi:hypothetical protein
MRIFPELARQLIRLVQCNDFLCTVLSVGEQQLQRERAVMKIGVE